MKLLRILFPLLLMAVSCARPISPTGGPKDLDPPNIVYSAPDNFTTDFRTSRIVLEFDEFVRVENAAQQVVVSPPLAQTPEMILRGKRLFITLPDSLLENTTYSFNLGEAVKDITEGNPLDSNLFVFSTGRFLDSLSVQGQLKNAFDLSPVAAATVMLYPEANDSLPLLEKPLYFAKTDDLGRFQLRYIRHGTYKLFALADANSNFLYDQTAELISFLPDLIDPAQPDTFRLAGFVAEGGKQFLKSAKATGYGLIRFVFNQPIKNALIRPLNVELDSAWFTPEAMVVGDTLRYWLTDPYPIDTLELEIADDTARLDTVKVALRSKEGKKGNRKKLKTGGNVSEFELTGKGGKHDYFLPYRIRTNLPIGEVARDSFFLVEGQDTFALPGEYIQSGFRDLTIRYPWKQDSAYALYILPGGVLDRYGQDSDTARFRFRTGNVEDYGDLTVDFRLPDLGHPYVVELYDNRDNLVRTDTLPGSRKVLYAHLHPKKYRFKLIYDGNGNGQWDTGDYWEKRQPEQVVFYQGEIDVRANWEVDIDWIVPED